MENINLNTNSNLKAFAGLNMAKVESQKSEIQTSKVNPAGKSEKPEIDLKNPEQARYEAVKKAAEKIVLVDLYPVSDVRFTIYKDKGTDGEMTFFTRFTSLRDGKVTVIPESRVLSAGGKDAGTLLETIV